MTDTIAIPTSNTPGTTSSSPVDRAVLGLAVLLVAAPVLRMLGIVIHPLDTADAQETLALVDDQAARWAVAHLIEPLGWILLGLSAFALRRLAPAAGRRLVTVGATLFALGCAGTGLLVYSHGEAYLKMAGESVDQAQMTALYEQFHEGVPLAAPLIPLYPLGAVLLALGLFRAGTVSKVAALLLPIAVVVPNALPPDTNLVITGTLGSAPLIAVVSVFAVALVRRSRVVTPAGPAGHQPPPAV